VGTPEAAALDSAFDDKADVHDYLDTDSKSNSDFNSRIVMVGRD
jgi:hypothetical protein